MKKISIIGLGYVGLPLSILFSKKNNVVGFDIDKQRINELKNNIDSNGEKIKGINNKKIIFTSDSKKIRDSDYYIVALPTPVNKYNKPDISMLISACKLISKFLKKGSVIIFESTVYPGLIEEKLLPILQKYSSLKINIDFFIGYSPERINPGDKKNKLENIIKITSGSDKSTAKKISKLYSKVLKNGVFEVDNIKIAEAAKVIENIQRDVNIALINNLYQVFTEAGLDFKKILDAASTKWNFLKFAPGIVGGHCVGVDPYYFIDFCKQKKINCKIVSTSRFFNEKFIFFLRKRIFHQLKNKNKKISNCRILILGATFKENCNDMRNSGAVKLYLLLKKNVKNIDIYDPLVSNQKLKSIITNFKKIKKNYYDAVILLVPHNKFKEIGTKKFFELGKPDCFYYDLKDFLFSSYV
jgi:UDP-N-acetyl-D-galactosamine dehydrogenase